MKIKISFSLFFLSLICYGQIQYDKIPINKQLVGRDTISNLGKFLVTGTITRDGTTFDYDSVIAKIYKGATLDTTKTITLNYVNNVALFNLSLYINAELTNHKLELWVKKLTQETKVKEVLDLVAGDVYIVQGQSNAVAQGVEGDTNTLNRDFIRSYGHNEVSNPDGLNLVQDHNWYIANGDKTSTEGFVGQWGLKLASLIVETYGIPVAIFNGARGGRRIDYFHAPSDYMTNPEASNYGHLYYRLNNSELKDKVRAILWSQGENNSDATASTVKYKADFNTLKSSWLSDYTGVSRFYIFQGKHGCNRELDDFMKISEAQRSLSVENKDSIFTMSIAGLTHKFDDCHFNFTDGYESFATRIFPLIRRDFYGASPNIDIEAPMIIGARIRNDSLVLETDASLLVMDLDVSDILSHYKLTGAGSTQITDIEVGKHEIRFSLSQRLPKGSLISYAPDSLATKFITNTKGIELLTFNEFPVSSIPDNNFTATFNPQVNDLGNNTIILPFINGNYDVDINNDGVFGDTDSSGKLLTNLSGAQIITFSDTNEHTLQIRSNQFNNSQNQLQISFNNNTVNKPEKLTRIDSWGDIIWINMDNAFYGCANLSLGSNVGAPDLTIATSAQNMFRDCSSLTNEDLSNWNVSNIRNTVNMFMNASSFNGDVTTWNVSSTLNMSRMFQGAVAFNQNIGSWNITLVTNMTDMFLNSTAFTSENYDLLLLGWSSLPSLQSGVSFGAPPVEYCAGANAVGILKKPPNNWSFTNDQGANSNCSFTFTGAVDTDWDTAGNWSGGVVPTASSIVVIPEGKVVEKTGSITVESLSILSEGHLTVTANLVSAETVKLYSNATILAKSSTPFDLTYYREIPSSNWHLISSPVLGESVLDLANNNAGLSLGSGSGVSQNIAIGFYDNSEALPDDRWKYYMIGNIDGLNGDDTIDNLNSGAGYAVKLDASGTILFRGTMPTANINRTISLGVGDNYNLLGNPFPSFISSGPVLSANTTLLKSETFWIWDQSTNGYITKLPAITAFNIAPGQAFFVEAKANGNMIFNESAQRRFFSNTFSKSETNRPEIKLNITSGVQEKYAELYYINGTTTGFDNGYDGPMFTGADTSFAIYTHLLSDNQGTAYAIQSLPNSNHDDMIVPVGVNATSGSEVVFSVDVKNFPEGMNVYLEDREKNILTHFNESTVNYTVSLNSDLQGVGRFYLWTTSSSLSASSIILDHVNMYITDNNTLHIIGIQGERTNISIYNILGKNVLSTSFTGKGVNEIKLSNVTTGVYVVQLKTTTGIVNKKIVID